jgi:hypothetical protein
MHKSNDLQRFHNPKTLLCKYMFIIIIIILPNFRALQHTRHCPVTFDFVALTLRGTIHHCSSEQSIVDAQGVVAPLAHRTVR